jgi:thiamine-phosphate pyrophosphorylase
VARHQRLGGAAGTIASARATAGKQSWISVAAHSDAAVRAAVAEGADAALVSPIFPTAPASEMRVRVRGPSSAPGGKTPRGTHALESARSIAPASFAIYALGGVSSHNAKSCIDAGADGVALIRGLLAAEDPVAETKALWRALGS